MVVGTRFLFLKVDADCGIFRMCGDYQGLTGRRPVHAPFIPSKSQRRAPATHNLGHRRFVKGLMPLAQSIGSWEGRLFDPYRRSGR
jgi:hypothetical protein